MTCVRPSIHTLKGVLGESLSLRTVSAEPTLEGVIG